MLTKIPEINPLDLLYNPYSPVTKEELADILGVTPRAIKSWVEKKRKPAKPVQKLAALILSQWQQQHQKST